MSTAPFDARTEEEALALYAQLSASHNPNDKFLALGGLVQFIPNADSSFLARCAAVTDYVFLDKMIRNGISRRFELFLKQDKTLNYIMSSKRNKAISVS
jgi:hypothetical protein